MTGTGKAMRRICRGAFFAGVCILPVMYLSAGASPAATMAPDEALGEGVPELVRAAGRGETEKIRLLIDEGADVNGRDGNGLTPLMHAARGGHAEAVELLLESGADASAQAGSTALYISGATALLLATASGHTGTADILRGVGLRYGGMWIYLVVIVWGLLWSYILLGTRDG